MTFDKAQSLLECNGFANVTYHDTINGDTVDVASYWTVVDQDPAAGSETQLETEINLGLRKSEHLDSASDSSPGAGSAVTEADQNSAPYNISDDECFSDSIGTLHYKGVITNTSNEAYSLKIDVTFVDENEVRIGEGFDIIVDLKPGESAAWDAFDFGTHDGDFTCKLSDISPI